MEPLINIIGDEQPTTRLRRVEVSYRSGNSETRVRARISQLLDNPIDLFEREFNHWLQVTSMGNHCKMWTSYKLIRDGKEAKICHLNAKGDIDRLVCIIHEDDVPDPIYVHLTRLQGNDSESLRLDIHHIRCVIPSKMEGRSNVVLHGGHQIPVRGSLEEVNQKIEDAKRTNK